MPIYYLHLGSNQGNRKITLQKTLQKIEEQVGQIEAESSIYETEPWGLKNQENFLNMAITVKSSKSPDQVFEITKAIEASFGGVKTVKWGPRVIDIDILYCDQQIIKTETLTIPHPQLYERNFVLIPLLEIAGDFIDPVLHKSIDEIYDGCKDEGEVFIYEE